MYMCERTLYLISQEKSIVKALADVPSVPVPLTTNELRVLHELIMRDTCISYGY